MTEPHDNDHEQDAAAARDPSSDVPAVDPASQADAEVVPAVSAPVGVPKEEDEGPPVVAEEPGGEPPHSAEDARVTGPLEAAAEQPDAQPEEQPEEDGEALEPLPAGEEVARPPSRRLVWMLGAVTALSVAAAVAMGAVYWVDQRSESAREAVREVAEEFAENLVSFDHRTLDEDIAQIERLATGNFRQELRQAFGGDVAVFQEAIRQAQAVSTGEVLALNVLEIEDENASVLAFVNQTIVNKETPEPRTVCRRVRLGLVDTQAGWRVDDVDAQPCGTG